MANDSMPNQADEVSIGLNVPEPDDLEELNRDEASDYLDEDEDEDFEDSDEDEKDLDEDEL